VVGPLAVLVFTTLAASSIRGHPPLMEAADPPTGALSLDRLLVAESRSQVADPDHVLPGHKQSLPARNALEFRPRALRCDSGGGDPRRGST
jgi:hypothetical protein